MPLQVQIESPTALNKEVFRVPQAFTKLLSTFFTPWCMLRKKIIDNWLHCKETILSTYPKKKEKNNNCNFSKGITTEFKDIGWYYNLLCLRLVTNHANASASIKNFGCTKKRFTEEFFITWSKYHTLHLGHKIPDATYSALHSLCHAWWYFTEFSTSVERSSSVESMYYKRKICSKIVFSSTERTAHTI